MHRWGVCNSRRHFSQCKRFLGSEVRETSGMGGRELVDGVERDADAGAVARASAHKKVSLSLWVGVTYP